MTSNLIGSKFVNRVQLKNFSLFATIRVMFQLSEEVPCISALVVALLAKVRGTVWNFSVEGQMTLSDPCGQILHLQ